MHQARTKVVRVRGHRRQRDKVWRDHSRLAPKKATPVLASQVAAALDSFTTSRQTVREDSPEGAVWNLRVNGKLVRCAGDTSRGVWIE